jgi:hypothetical protein
MAKISTHPIAPIIAISERWKQDCLIGDGSLFSSARLWTLDNVNQFKHYFVDNLIYGNDQTFYEKFEIQLADAPAEVTSQPETNGPLHALDFCHAAGPSPQATSASLTFGDLQACASKGETNIASSFGSCP